MLHLKTAILNAEAKNNTRLVGIRRVVNELQAGGKRKSRSHRLDSAIEEYHYRKPRVCVDVNLNDEDWFVQLVKACVNKKRILIQMSGDHIGYFYTNYMHPDGGYFYKRGQTYWGELKKDAGWIYEDYVDHIFEDVVERGQERYWFELNAHSDYERHAGITVVTDTRIKDIPDLKKWAASLGKGDVKFTTLRFQDGKKINADRGELDSYIATTKYDLKTTLLQEYRDAVRR